MKKYFVICLSLFLLANSSFVIKVKPCDCAEDKEKVFQYFNYIYNAENFIIENNYDSALYCYVNASLLAPIMVTDIGNRGKLINKSISNESLYYCFYNAYCLLHDSVSLDFYLQRISKIIPLDVVAKLDSSLSNAKKNIGLKILIRLIYLELLTRYLLLVLKREVFGNMDILKRENLKEKN